MASAQAQTYRTHSAEETVQLGVELAREMKPPQLVLLIGELGCGKTTLAKGLISGLGVALPPTSLARVSRLSTNTKETPRSTTSISIAWTICPSSQP